MPSPSSFLFKFNHSNLFLQYINHPTNHYQVLNHDFYKVPPAYYRRYNHIAHDFEKEFGALSCTDISEPYGDWHSKERRKNCLKLIANSAKLAYDYLMVSQEEAFALPYKENISKRED